MTCRMAAGQRKKPLRSSNIYELYRGKKKRKMDSSDILLNLKSHIDLHWDDSHKTVVSKMEQIGISWTDMSEFIDSVTQPHSGIADVISVPRDIYSLADLSEVLSYEVWTSVLSESERELLTQFLPSGTDAEQIVHSLLEGENYNFGNPFLKWSTSLCTGNLHPDVVLQKDRRIKTGKKAYYRRLNKYHMRMLELLTKWTEKWLNCKDPEKLQSEGFFKNKEACSAGADKAKAPITIKREMSQKIGTQKRDTDKYISYIKITRAQHEMVKTIKNSGDGIPVKSLTHVIGDIKTCQVHSYDKFEVEEKNQIHAHWLQVVKEDIPTAFELSRERLLQREKLNRSLEEDLAEKLKFMTSEVEMSQNSVNSTEEHSCDDDPGEQHISDVDSETGTYSEYNSAEDNQLDNSPLLHSPSEASPMVITEEVIDDGQANDMSPHSHSSGTKSQEENDSEPEASTSSAKQMWQTANEQGSCYYTSVDNNDFTSVGELSLGQPHHREHTSDIVDLDGEIIGTKTEGSVQLPFEMNDSASLFFGNQDRNEVVPTLPRGSAIISSYQPKDLNDMKQNGLQFLMSDVSLPQSGQFPNQLAEQQLEQQEAREKELFMHRMSNKTVYAASRYPTQGQFPTVEQQSFTALQPSVSSDSVGYNWLPADNPSYNNWYGVETSSSCLSAGNGNVDETLYNILPNRIPTSYPYNAMSSEQYVQARNLAGEIMPNSQNIYDYAHQLEDPNFQDSASVLSMNNDSWMNLPHQNSTSNDSLGAPYIKPWSR